MKLKATDWKHAWFESHISERFFAEMAKLEKGNVQGLLSTAQWMEQIMIEVGALAQAMIRLEQDGAPEPQIRQAGDKSMRVAALALHLITALDSADREQVRSSAIVRGEYGDWQAPRSPMPVTREAEPPAPAAPPQVAAAPAPPPVPNPPQLSPVAAALLERGGLTRGQPAARPAQAAPEDAAAAAPEAAPDKPRPGLISTLLQVTGRQAPRSESHMRGTIVSLDQQGLSRAEIEMVTGEPRHVIEAVLKQARGDALASGRRG